jgi:hypothetical protein
MDMTMTSMLGTSTAMVVQENRTSMFTWPKISELPRRGMITITMKRDMIIRTVENPEVVDMDTAMAR